MDHNLAAIEVKPVTACEEDLRTDFRKLNWFCQHAQYHGGVQLIYGEVDDIERLRAKLLRTIDDNINTAVLTVLHHGAVGQRPDLIAW